MMNFKDKTVLVTGGASGIGKIMASLLLERQAKVILWDINQERISETLAELSAKGIIKAYCVDVSDTKQVQEAAEKVKQENASVDVLINNAGVVVGKFFHEHSLTDINKTLEINTSAPMHITLAFLNDMMAQNSGHICNIASAAGIVSNPKMSVYAASKWALVGWSDSLRLEMKQLRKKVNITTILPYYINTGMFEGVKSKIPILEPEAAARAIIKAIERNKKMVTLPGFMYRTTRLSQAILTVNCFDWLAGGVLGMYKTMESFTGHKK